jgi:hypothetical protein
MGYTDSLQSLVENARLPQAVAEGACAGIPAITLTSGGYQVSMTFYRCMMYGVTSMTEGWHLPLW